MDVMRNKATAIFLITLIIVVFSDVCLSEEADLVMIRQPLEVVDLPTAGLIPRGGFRIRSDIYGDGGVLVFLDVGFTRNFNFGISYGGSNIIGSGDPDLNPRPEASIRVRILEEKMMVPAIAIGFSSQGFGKHIDDKDACDEKRYLVKSRGVYAVASKNWDVLGPLSLHFGISISLENDLDHDPTFFAGFVKSLEAFDIGIEYDFGFNDNEGRCDTVQRRGYLNCNIIWHMAERISLAVTARDLVSKSKKTGGSGIEPIRRWNRGIAIGYLGFL